jgi:hypothetical protein
VTDREGGAGVTKLTVVAIALLFGVLVGLAYEPDVGTPVSVHRTDVAGAIVAADHAKPLPNVKSVSDMLAFWQVLTPTLIAVALFLWSAPLGGRRIETDGDRDPSTLWSLERARRGPPALV